MGRLPRSTSLPWLLLGAGIALTSLAYAPALQAGFMFDDDPNIVYAEGVHWTELSPASLEGLLRGTRLPRRLVANATFGLNHRLGGLEPFGYHLVNVLVHLAVGLALTWVTVLYLRAEGERPSSEVRLLWPASMTVLFWLHPLNTQAVTYVVQRMTSLAALFSLIGFGLYLTGRGRASLRAGSAWYAGALLAWLVAIGSKENAVAMALVVATYEACFHREWWREAWHEAGPRRKAALVILPAVLMISGLWAVAGGGAGAVSWSATWADRDFNGWERVLTQARVHVLYLSLLVWPSPGRLNLDHDFVVSRGILDPPSTALAVMFWVAVAVSAVVAARRHPLVAFPLLAYLELHLIESGPVNLEIVFEHRMYLPMCMIALLGAALLHRTSKPRRTVLAAAVLTLAVPLAGATRARNRVWADPIAFHVDVAAKSPNKFRPQYNLGTALGKAGRAMEARAALLRAAQLDSTDSATRNQLGNTYLATGEPPLALEQYRRAVDLEPRNAEALYNLGMLLEQLGRRREAEPYLRRFVEVAPPWLEAAARRVEEALARGGGARRPSVDTSGMRGVKR